MRFLADENCDIAVVRALRDAGHDVTMVKDRCRGAEDEAVAALALSEKRVLITEDKGFGQIAQALSAARIGVGRRSALRWSTRLPGWARRSKAALPWSSRGSSG